MTPHQKANKKVIWYILEALDWFLGTRQKIIFIGSPVTEIFDKYRDDEILC